MDLKDYIKQKHLAADKWAEIKDIMGVHIYGAPPERIFKTRRPLESTNDYALIYRLENWQPITRSSFATAINAILETAQHIYLDVQNVDSNTADFIDDTNIRIAGKSYSLKKYVFDYVARMVEYDPNAVLVCYPVHPDQPLIPDFREELPNFNSIQNRFVDIAIELIPSEKINKINEEMCIFEAGQWVYDVKKDEELTAPYYYMLDKEMTSLIIPYKVKDQYDYRIEDYYLNDLEILPFDIIGGNAVLEEIDDQMVEYYETTYSGAASIANELIGIKSDEQICMTRFVYPESFRQMDRCGHPGCIECRDPKSPYAGLFVQYETDGSCSTCSTCSGTGKVMPDSSPLGTHWISKSDLFSDEGKFVPPLHFVTPPLESPKFLSEQVQAYFDQMQDALFIMRQNMTNQSGVSKSYDVRQKVTTLTNACNNIIDIYQRLLNTIQGFLKGEQDIVINTPPDYNIKTSQDITIELAESRNTSSVYTSELTRELLIKKFGQSDENRRIIDFLEIQDKMWGMTMNEILQLKAIYGNAMTPRDQIIHDKGFAIMKKLSKDESFMSWSDDRLKTLFEAEIDKLQGLDPELEEIAEDPLAKLEMEAKSKLKGTVGGVQGIIQINAAVAAGQMTEDAAQALLQEIYGFSSEIADRLIEPTAIAETPPADLTSPIA